MKKGSLYIFAFFYVLVGASLFLSPSSIVFAQDDAVEEIFWGDEDDGALDDDFEFSEEDEFDDELENEDDGGLEGFDFDDDEFSDDEFSDDEFSDDFSEDFSDEEEDLSGLESVLGYTLNITGASAGFVNNPLQTYNSNAVDFRVSLELPMALQIAGIRFRLGAEAGTFSFKNYMPKGGVFSGVHINGIVSFPAGPGQVKLGGGIFGSGVGFVAENSYGMSLRNTSAANMTTGQSGHLIFRATGGFLQFSAEL